MKKFWLTGLAFTLILCMMLSTALAVDGTIMRVDMDEAQEKGFYPSVDHIAVLGDTVYMLGQTTENYYAREILRWQQGMESVETYVGGLLYACYFDNVENAQYVIDEREMDADIEHAVSYFFSDGERLLGMNHLNGKIFAISAQDGKPVYEDVATIADTSAFYHKTEDYAYFIYPDKVACVGDRLLWSIRDWDDEKGQSVNKTFNIDLKSGSVITSSLEDVMSIASYKDGKALVLSRKEEDAWDQEHERYRPLTVISYDPVSNKAEKIGEFEYDRWAPQYFLYSEALDAIICDSSTRIMALSNNFKESKQVGYIPLSYIRICAIVGDTMVICGDSESSVIVRTLSKDFKTDEYVNVLYGYMDEAARAFAEEYPQIPIYSVFTNSTDAVAIDQLMKAGNDAPDIMQLDMATSVYTRLVEKKGCEDLSGNPKLAAFVNDLYPAYKEAVTGENGEIWGIPINAYSWDGYFVNKKVMDEMGLTIDEIPTNLVELCEFATRWNDEFVDKFPNYTLLEYVSDYKASMFSMVFERYIAYCGATDTTIKFDTPIFRELVAAVEAMEVKELNASLKSTDPEVSDYKQGLIWRGDMLVGNMSDFESEQSDRIFIPMGLTKDAGYYTGVELQIMFISSTAKHKDYAAKLMEYVVDKLNDRIAYTLLATKDQPLENEYYSNWLESQQSYLERLEKSLADAPDAEKADWQTQIAEQKAYIEKNKESRRYTISPSAIKTYRETIMPYVSVTRPSFLDASDEGATQEFSVLIKQYQDGNIDIDRFIKDADGKLLLMQNE